MVLCGEQWRQYGAVLHIVLKDIYMLRTMSHWQLHAVTAAFSRCEKVGSGRANMTLKAGSSHAGKSDSRMARVMRWTSAGRCRLFSSRVSVRMPSNLWQQHAQETNIEIAHHLRGSWPCENTGDRSKTQHAQVPLRSRTLALAHLLRPQQPASAIKIYCPQSASVPSGYSSWCSRWPVTAVAAAELAAQAWPTAAVRL